MTQAFRPAARLRTRRDFSGVFDQGSRRHGQLMSVLVRHRAEGPARLGVVAGRKLGNAVERNRAKRRIRELFRRSARPAGLDLVVIPKRSLLSASAAGTQQEFDGLMDWASRHVRRSQRL